MTRKLTPKEDDFDDCDLSVDERIARLDRFLKIPPYAPPVQSTKPKAAKSAVSKRANANKAKERSEEAHKDIGDFPSVVSTRPRRPLVKHPYGYDFTNAKNPKREN
jgi:hypothetical protein